MNRRTFVVGVGTAMASPVFARAQNATLIGLLGSGSAEGNVDMVSAFRRGLGEAGYGDVTIDARWVAGQYDRLPALAAELVQRRVAVIVAVGGNAPAQAAKSATTEIPIVFVSGGEPVKDGLVASLAHPGGNVTGVSWIAAALTAKRFELLHQLVSRVDLVGVLLNPNYPDSDLQRQEVREAAQTIGQRIEIAEARSADEIESAVIALVRDHADALLVANDPFFHIRADNIVALASRHALPACYFERTFTTVGGLVSYGANLSDAYRQAGIYTGRVLKGEKPADLPVQQPTTFELVINLKTARSLGLEVPASVLARADEVIE